ncbi:hypothetical protein WK95_00705 [Burkholderia ubonensis]|nr:hypothetical protein WJ70_13340 [Burkholderia ubonensis]KVW48251.1 hypothetical protein WK95_00705 [Burkholderia ubonensis]
MQHGVIAFAYDDIELITNASMRHRRSVLEDASVSFGIRYALAVANCESKNMNRHETPGLLHVRERSGGEA